MGNVELHECWPWKEKDCLLFLLLLFLDVDGLRLGNNWQGSPARTHRNACFYALGFLSVGVVITRAILFGVYIAAPDVWKLSNEVPSTRRAPTEAHKGPY